MAFKTLQKKLVAVLGPWCAYWTIKLLGLARAGGTNDIRQFQVGGAFTLHRISDVPTLTTTR